MLEQYDSSIVGEPISGFVCGEKGVLGDLSGAKITKIKAAS
jgi:hypothetical protein